MATDFAAKSVRPYLLTYIQQHVAFRNGLQDRNCDIIRLNSVEIW